jgi:putative nucleotidyltransferase with HDIG domain
MHIETTFLHSKLARRIFWLFVLCALLPITVLAVVSLWNVTAQLREQSIRELHQVSREEAMSICGRLSFLEANLRLVTPNVRSASGQPSAADAGDSSGPYSELANRFDGLEVVTVGGNHQRVFRKVQARTEFTEGEQKFLRSGHSLLATTPCDKAQPCIFLSRALNAEDLSEGILVGQVRPAYLWDAENLPESTITCVLDAMGQPLFCSGEAPKRFPEQLAHTFSGHFEWQGNNREYLANYWNLALQSSYFVPHWTIVSSEAKPDVMAPLKRFRTSFLLVFLLALWIILLLSLMQIRRNLVPLEKLKEGTRGISKGEFETRVAITSGDEFEELAASFNSMASRIEKQVSALKVVNEIDGAILSAWDLTRIVHTVCRRMRDLLPHHLVSVSLIEAAGAETALTHVYSPGSEMPQHTESLQLTPQEVKELREQSQVSVLDDSGAPPRYVEPLRERGMKHFLAVRVSSDKGPLAIFTLGHATAVVWSEEDKEQARNLADQIAVAFSNAELVHELEQLQWGTLTALARAIDAKSPWTLGHSERVTACAIKIAKAMGLPPKELDIMRRGGLLHDIGKIGTPADILDKPGKLTEEELKLMREHVNIGARILQPVPGLGESMSIVLQHHEWVNGGGYPNGLAGEEITLHARIFAVADCYDALISDRPYRSGMPIERVLQIIQQGAGKQFDPRVIEVFRTVMQQEAEMASVEKTPGAFVEVG